MINQSPERKDEKQNVNNFARGYIVISNVGYIDQKGCKNKHMKDINPLIVGEHFDKDKNLILGMFD